MRQGGETHEPVRAFVILQSGPEHHGSDLPAIAHRRLCRAIHARRQPAEMASGPYDMVFRDKLFDQSSGRTSNLFSDESRVLPAEEIAAMKGGEAKEG